MGHTHLYLLPMTGSSGLDRPGMSGGWLREHRERIGLRQAEFARRVGVSAPLVARWENETKPIAVAHHARIRQILTAAAAFAPAAGRDRSSQLVAAAGREPGNAKKS